MGVGGGTLCPGFVQFQGGTRNFAQFQGGTRNENGGFGNVCLVENISIAASLGACTLSVVASNRRSSSSERCSSVLPCVLYGSRRQGQWTRVFATFMLFRTLACLEGRYCAS